MLSLELASDGGYILGGYSYSGISGDKTQASQGLSDYWIVKTNANGIKQWDSRFGGSEDDWLNSLDQTLDGGYILGGLSESGISGDKTQPSQGHHDYWIVKTDVNGIKQWDARYGGDWTDWLYSIDQTSDGGYILGGLSNSGISGDKTQESQGGDDYWIVKTDANGLKQWDTEFGGWQHDWLFSLQQTSDDGYILGGRSLSGMNGDKTQPNWDTIPDYYGNFASDYWIVKITREFGVGIAGYEKNAVACSVFPNPADDVFYLNLTTKVDLNGIAKIEVVNLLGQIIHSQNAMILNGKLQQEIQLSSTTAEGTYLVKVSINDQTYASQISYLKQ
ncbi:MAG: T9SS type A sorting domain-containing protein [Chitinophagales bacterium]|nr:T9SS type A sorting domain-containing protein [Chitinophagales bacterium]